jgi:hypothetical protein
MVIDESGMVVDAAGGVVVDGFTEVSVELAAGGMVAEVSVDMPVAAEPLHQSLLARALGEAFR